MPTNSDKGQQPNNALPNYTPAWLANLIAQPFPAQPNQIGLLARDMALGGYGGNAANMAWLQQMFPTATIMRPGVAAPVTPTVPGKPTSPTNPTQQQPKTPDRRSYYDRGGGR